MTNLHIERPKPKASGLSISFSNGKKLDIQKPVSIVMTKKTEEPAAPPPSAPAKVPTPFPGPDPAEPAPEPTPEPTPAPEMAAPAPTPEEPKPEPKPEAVETPEPAAAPKPVKEDAPKSAEINAVEEEDEEEEYKGEVLEESRKKTINLVFIGHVDAGKSTLCGHLLFEAGIVDQRTIERYQKEAQEKGRQSWYFSWVMDLADTERAKGKTEEVGVAHFETEAYKYTVLDAPGHRSYVPQMIGGAVQADVAVLVISARTGEFESGFEKGGQTSEHLLIAKTAGVRYVICVINKMDDPTVKWSKERYDQIRERFNPFITREIGFKSDQYIYIPIAALGGGNLKERATDCAWYTGPTLFEALDKCPMPPRNDTDAFRLPVIDRYKTKYLYAMGKIEKGVIHEGSKIIVMPSGVKGTIGGIFDDEAKIRTAVPGDNIRVHINGIETTDICSGSVICLDTNPCSVATKCIVKLKFTPSAPQFITAGFSAICHIHTEIAQVTFKRMMAVIGPKPEKNPKYVRAGQVVQCIIEFGKPICIETFTAFPQLGRFIIRHEGFTIAVGVIESLPKANKA